MREGCSHMYMYINDGCRIGTLLSMRAVMCELEPSVLLAETHQPRPVQSPATFTPLSFPEFPNRGDVVGIDAEFVSLNQVGVVIKELSKKHCWSS